MEEKRVRRDRGGNENTIGDGRNRVFSFRSLSRFPFFLSFSLSLCVHKSRFTRTYTHIHSRNTYEATYRYRVVDSKTHDRIFGIVRSWVNMSKVLHSFSSFSGLSFISPWKFSRNETQSLLQLAFYGPLVGWWYINFIRATMSSL